MPQAFKDFYKEQKMSRIFHVKISVAYYKVFLKDAKVCF